MNHHTSTINDRVFLGFWIYIMSDCVLFSGLFAVYAILHGQTFGGPTPESFFNLPYVFVETLLLLSSSFTCGLATLAAYRGRKPWTVGLLIATLVLGASFLTMELAEFGRLIADGHGWRASAFLSSFSALVGTHGLHVFVGSLWMMVLVAHIALRGLSESTLRKLACMSLFWHFLDIVWICIFTFVYIWPLI